MAAPGRNIVIGAGNIGLQLLRLLSRDMELVCVDPREKALAAAREVRGEGLRTVAGDATSRLVLEEAGAAQAEAVVITTAAERTNVEIARLLREHFHPRRVLAVGITGTGIATLEELGVEVVEIFSLSATALRNRLEQRTKAVDGIGLGKSEILEVEVHPHSRLAGKPLASLNPKSWRVGIVYRDGNILIPGGNTVLRGKDRVVLLGDPGVLRTVSDLLGFRFLDFPLEYGDTLVAWFSGREKEGYLEEIDYLLDIFPIPKALFLLDGPPRPALEERLRETAQRHHLKRVDVEAISPLSPLEAFRTLLQGRLGDACLFVLPAATALSSPLRTERGGKKFLQELARRAGCPLLLAAGSFPYARVAVPSLVLRGLEEAVETALEMSATVNPQIDALFVSPSVHISSEREGEEYRNMLKLVSDLSLAYRRGIRVVELKGNPVRAAAASLESYNLAVAAIAGWRRKGGIRRLFEPDVGWETVRRGPVSVLLIPPTEGIA